MDIVVYKCECIYIYIYNYLYIYIYILSLPIATVLSFDLSIWFNYAPLDFDPDLILIQCFILIRFDLTAD